MTDHMHYDDLRQFNPDDPTTDTLAEQHALDTDPLTDDEADAFLDATGAAPEAERETEPDGAKMAADLHRLERKASNASQALRDAERRFNAARKAFATAGETSRLTRTAADEARTAYKAAAKRWKWR